MTSAVRHCPERQGNPYGVGSLMRDDGRYILPRMLAVTADRCTERSVKAADPLVAPMPSWEHSKSALVMHQRCVPHRMRCHNAERCGDADSGVCIDRCKLSLARYILISLDRLATSASRAVPKAADSSVARA